jgi:methionyl-tRNA formyltransferase
LCASAALAWSASLRPPERRRHGDEIQPAGQLLPERIFDASRLRDPAVQRTVDTLQPESGLSVLLGYILAPEFLSVFPAGVVKPALGVAAVRPRGPSQRLEHR